MMTKEKILVRLVARTEDVLLDTVYSIANNQANNETVNVEKLATFFRSFLADMKKDIRLITSFEDYTPELGDEIWRDAMSCKANVPK